MRGTGKSRARIESVRDGPGRSGNIKAEGVVIVTSFNAAETLQSMSRMAIVVASSIAVAALAGCGSVSTMFGGAEPEVAQAAAPAAVAPKKMAQVAVLPVLGAPEDLSDKLSERVVAALAKRNVLAVKGKESEAEHYLRGYVTASRVANGTKVTYIWDVTDKAGSSSSHRVQGTETIPGKAGQGSWAGVTDSGLDTLAAKAAGGVGDWMATKKPAAAGPAVAKATTPAATSGTAAAPAVATATQAAPPATQAVATPTEAARASVPRTTASVSSGGARGATFVPAVTGAPGDGSNALAAALRRELGRQQISVTETSDANGFKVQGKVGVGQVSGGKQAVRIDWIVSDARGKVLGSVVQQNSFPQGALDGPWGETATAAAADAAPGIAKIIQEKAAN